MEPNVGETQVYFSSNPWFKRKLFWVIFTLVMILIPVGAYLYGIYFIKPTTPSALPPPTAKNTLKEENLPIAFDILQNPMVYEWRGSAEGILVAKDDHSITLADDQNHTLTITVIPSTDVIYGTKFFIRETKDDREQFVETDYQGLPMGTKLRGDFFVAAREKDKKIGSSFEIIEQ